MQKKDDMDVTPFRMELELKKIAGRRLRNESRPEDAERAVSLTRKRQQAFIKLPPIEPRLSRRRYR
jgi:hypothetical protein